MTVILLAVAVLALLVIAVALVAAVVFIAKNGLVSTLNPGVPLECCEAKDSPNADIVLEKLDGLSDQLGKIMELLVQILEEEQKGNDLIERTMSARDAPDTEKPPRKTPAARRAPRKRKAGAEGNPAGEG